MHVGRQRHAARLLERALEARPRPATGRTSQRPSPSASTGSIASPPASASTLTPARMRRDGRTSASHRPSPALLEQQHLPAPAARPAHGDARAQHAAAVGDDEVARIEQLDELGEAAVLDRPVAPVHEQARAVPALGGPLRDQLLGQRVVELVGAHTRQSRRRPAALRRTGWRDRRRDRRGARPPCRGRRAARRSRSSCAATGGASTRSRCASAATPTTPRTRSRRRSSPPTARCRASTGRARVSTWLYRIATNKCYDVAGAAPSGRRCRRGCRSPPTRTTPSRAARAEQLLARALDALPEHSARPPCCATSAASTPAEAGEVLGVPEGTMKSRSFRARGLLAVGAARGRRGTGAGERGLKGRGRRRTRSGRDGRGARRGRARPREPSAAARCPRPWRRVSTRASRPSSGSVPARGAPDAPPPAAHRRRALGGRGCGRGDRVRTQLGRRRSCARARGRRAPCARPPRRPGRRRRRGRPHAGQPRRRMKATATPREGVPAG